MVQFNKRILAVLFFCVCISTAVAASAQEPTFGFENEKLSSWHDFTRCYFYKIQLGVLYILNMWIR